MGLGRRRTHKGQKQTAQSASTTRSKVHLPSRCAALPSALGSPLLLLLLLLRGSSAARQRQREQSRAEQSRAEQSRAERAAVPYARSWQQQEKR
jgi:hypothetical protein